jgi:hypothetical protein
MAGEHAPAQPSSLARTVQCPGHIKLEALYPETEDSDEAREGTAAHWALREVLEGRPVAEGQVTDAGFVLTREMVEAAEDVLRWIHSRIAAHGGEVPLMRVEQRLPPSARIHPHCWGTPDLVLHFPAAQRLYVLDLKYGHGWVEVFENEQLTAYTCLALDDLRLSDLTTAVTMVIYQPRSYHPDGPHREWSVIASDLRAKINHIRAAVEEALGPDPKLKVGPECTHCRARHACPALEAKALQAVDKSRSAVPFDLPPHALGVELADVRAALKALTARETGLAGQAQALILRGDRVPFWGIESKPGPLEWTASVPEVIALGEMLGVPLAKPQDAITPTQAKAKGLDESIVAAYAERSRGVAKLVPRTDESARRIFG